MKKLIFIAGTACFSQKIVQPRDSGENVIYEIPKYNNNNNNSPLGDCVDRKELNQYFDDLGRNIDNENQQQILIENSNNNNNNSNILTDPGGTDWGNEGFEQCGACCCNYALGQLDCRFVNEDQIRTLSKHKAVCKMLEKR